MYRTGVDKQKKCIATAKRYKGACENIAYRGPDVSILGSSSKSLGLCGNARAYVHKLGKSLLEVYL